MVFKGEMIMSYREDKKPTVSLIIIAVNICVYVALALLSWNPLKINVQLLALFGQSNYYVFNGAYWQLFTALFIHANLLHLLGNMFFFFIFGLKAEEMFSLTEYMLVYFGCGLSGNLLTLLMGPFVVSVGASGAIFGVFGATVMYIRRNFGQSIMGALIYSIYLFMFNVGENVNLLAHFGGLAAGLFLGYVLWTLKARRRLKDKVLKHNI